MSLPVVIVLYFVGQILFDTCVHIILHLEQILSLLHCG